MNCIIHPIVVRIKKMNTHRHSPAVDGSRNSEKNLELVNRRLILKSFFFTTCDSYLTCSLSVAF